jgi:glucokinase
MSGSTQLIADIGGTNARFALAQGESPGFSNEETLQCADFPSVEDAINHYLQLTSSNTPDVICLAAAGPLVDQRITMTNNHWVLAVDDLRQTFSTDAVRLLNDFEAIAYSVPALSETDCVPVGFPSPIPLPDGDYSVAIVGPGTGLGAVGLHRSDGRLIPVPGEAGHTGFAPETRVQLDVLVELREQFDRVSTERLLSGPGIENVYMALGHAHGEKPPKLRAREIFEAAGQGESRAAEAVALFFEILGQFAGDYVLALGAYDGVYIAGGIVRRYPEQLANSRFRSGFEGKGRYRPIMERIATRLIVHPQPGLLGASYVAQEMAAA